nr:transposase [Paracoccus zeaxanthinifaciens]
MGRVGLTPRANSSGRKEKLGRISKAGSRYLRRPLYLGTMAQISARRGCRVGSSGPAPDWLDRMLVRKPVKVVAVALANLMAQTIWALIARGGSYRATPA